MKKILLIAAVPFAFLLLQGCDKVDPPYIDGNVTPPIDTTEFPVPTFPADTHHVKTVLIEEYTGHTCVNCPTAAGIAHDIVDTYGEKVILMAIHAGYFAQTESPNYLLDLNTTAGTELHANFGITNNPAAIFNRKAIGGTLIFEAPTGWEATFIAAQDTVPVLDMQMINDFHEADNKVGIHVQTEYMVELDRNLKIALYVTEDSLIGYQRNSNPAVGTTPEIVDYVFMHVLRGSVNGTWGTDLSSGLVEEGTKTITSFSLVLGSGWDHDNCRIVAIVYDADTDEVLQAVEEWVE
jgi:hypothetical protein